MKINGNPDGGGGGSAVIEGLSITSNGTYTAGAGVDGYSPVEVDVPSPEFVTETLNVSVNNTYYPGQGVDGFSQVVVDVQPELQNKTVVENGEYIADQGYYGLGTVTVSVPSPQFVTESLSVSVNGTYTPGQGVDGYSQVVVDVPQSVTGFTEKEITERSYRIGNLNNSALIVGGYAFFRNYSIVTVNLPNCLQVGPSWTTEQSAFALCPYLQTVNLPVCFYINDGTFCGCSALSYISIPSCQYINNKAFQSCTILSSLDLPECISIGNYAFQNCTSLSQISLPECKNIGSYCFTSTNLESITLLAISVCSLVNANAFTNTPISRGTGSIYVPASLVSDYKTANRWSQYSSRIFPIE